jgi:hypothetical protein
MEEGTYNPINGHFLCDQCYIEAGMPVGENGRRGMPAEWWDSDNIVAGLRMAENGFAARGGRRVPAEAGTIPSPQEEDE